MSEIVPHISPEDGAWIMAFIAMVGATCAGLFKLIQANGCNFVCRYWNNTECIKVDCERDRKIEMRNDDITVYNATEDQVMDVIKRNGGDVLDRMERMALRIEEAHKDVFKTRAKISAAANAPAEVEMF